MQAKKTVELKIDATKVPATTIGDLRDLIKDFPGESLVRLACITSEGPKTLELGPAFRVAPDSNFFAEVKVLLGEAALS